LENKMSENSKIEWTDHTFNPWEGCQKVGPGCDHCYAETRNARFAGGTAVNWGPGAPRRRTSASNWELPKRWNAQAEAFMNQHGRRQRVFCASLADVFDNAVDPQWREDLFQLIAATPHLDWLLLTKRIGNVGNMLPVPFDFAKQYPNVWLGATITSQAEADRDIPKLLALDARVRFLSMEPLLGPVDLRHLPHGEGEIDCLNPDRWEDEIEQWRDTDEDWVDQFEEWYEVNLSDGLTGPMYPGINWVIVGGESGPGARPMHPAWASGLRDQCAAAGVPILFKQWGEWKPICQMPEPEHRGLYKSTVAAKPHQSQENLDDIYGRRCTVPTTVLHVDGSVHDITEPMAFLQGTDAMQIFRVGKKAAGRLLDGRTWDQAPAP
jgi:protein gp37